MSTWIICDIDGVLADCSWRAPLAKQARATSDPQMREEMWQEFHCGAPRDPLHHAEAMLVLAMVKDNCNILYITGRPERMREETRRWLQSHGLPHDTHLLMRPDGTTAPSAAYKERMLSVSIHQIMQPNDRIAFVLDDDDACVAMYRTHGLTVLQPRHNQY